MALVHIQIAGAKKNSEQSQTCRNPNCSGIGIGDWDLDATSSLRKCSKRQSYRLQLQGDVRRGANHCQNRDTDRQKIGFSKSG